MRRRKSLDHVRDLVTSHCAVAHISTSKSQRRTRDLIAEPRLKPRSAHGKSKRLIVASLGLASWRHNSSRCLPRSSKVRHRRLPSSLCMCHSMLKLIRPANNLLKLQEHTAAGCTEDRRYRAGSRRAQVSDLARLDFTPGPTRLAKQPRGAMPPFPSSHLTALKRNLRLTPMHVLGSC